MGAFIRVELVAVSEIPVGTEILVSVDQIVSIEPSFREPTQSIVRLSVPQMVRNDKAGTTEMVPLTYVVLHTVKELEALIAQAVKAQFN